MYNESTISVRITSIVQETEQVKRFTLAAANGDGLPRFSGGSHISTYLETPKGLLIRQYSLTSHPDECSHYEIAVRLSEASKGGSQFWHQAMKVGDSLQISYPKNHFPLSFKALHHVFYAAGIGITPFLSMMHELKKKGQTFELHYASKSIQHSSFYEFLKEHYSGQCHFYFSEENHRITTSSLKDHLIGTHVYFCGPESFIEDFTKVASDLGYPKKSVHLERFSPPQLKTVKPFKVTLKSGTKIGVDKKQTLLDALLQNGLNVPYSCRVGRCGTCELPVIEGEVDHFDFFLSEDQQNAQNCILPCVSRAKSDKLVIEVE
ncbi:ferredoxin [Fictibacillus phosphorivorans]|uniref:Ferredoxin n=1 Tax=Fictibacillus phosphorivorans TaxID=1221500 RepID=A0A163QBC2_9BACL|nr:PDR/VanB family oxidoreductase [Fictibacillus phosphorivorans]KZE64855.1 ferredoxin [Fictibacillus phosphorivorans]